MNKIQDGMLLRIFIGETDKAEGKPLYEKIVHKAKELNLASASVTRGIIGYGADNEIHSAKILRLSDDLPVIVEIIDTEENLNTILPFLERWVNDGFATLEKVRVIKYSDRES